MVDYGWCCCNGYGSQVLFALLLMFVFCAQIMGISCSKFIMVLMFGAMWMVMSGVAAMDDGLRFDLHSHLCFV